MEKKDILGRVDHTLLEQTATREQIETLCRKGMEHTAASACIPPCYAKRVKEYTRKNLAICTVTGFPNSNMTTAAKVFEMEDTVRSSTDEVDMVINIGMAGEGLCEQVLEGIRQIKVVYAEKYPKAITETCLLTENEEKEMCRMVTQSGADCVKTPTGFFIGGAAREDMALLRKYSGPQVRVKAAGGIAPLQNAEDFTVLGADRLGTSRLILQKYGMCRNMECVEVRDVQRYGMCRDVDRGGVKDNGDGQK